MKKQLLQERFQQLAGIKPMYAINSLNEEDVDLEKSLEKNVSGFRADLSKIISDPKVKAVLSLGDQDGDDSDDKLPYVETKVAVKNLIPTQNEIGFDESVEGDITDQYDSLKGILQGTPDMGGPIVTYAGKYIIDGHHRWSAVFAANPGANMEALDIKAKPGFQPTDILKAVHTAIAVELDKVPSSTAKGHNILSSPKSYEEVLATVKEKGTDKARKVWDEFGFKTDEQIAKRLTKNLNLIANKGAVSGAPNRTDMPQTDADKTSSVDKVKSLATGKINIAPPFKKGDKKLKENRRMKKSEFRALIREQIKRTLKEAAVTPPPLPGKKGGTPPPLPGKKSGTPPPLPGKKETETMTITDLGNKFLGISREMKGSKLKGMEASEIKAISTLLDKILQSAQDGSTTALLQRLDKMIK